MSIAEALQAYSVKKTNEKSVIDKILAKDDIEKIRRLMQKSDLTRDELLDLLYLVSSSESKLYNFDERERYVMMKMYVWVREFVSILEEYYDVYEKKEHLLSPYGKKLLRTNRLLLEHQVKFLVDLYLNISRTSLSKNGHAFKMFLENKFEFAYDNKQTLIDQQNKRPNLLGGLGGQR